MVELAKSKLGYPKLCVELDDSNFEAAAFDTELWIAVHLGQTRKTSIDLSRGKSEYNLPDDCEYVVDVALPARWRGTFPQAVDIEGADGFYYGQFYRMGSRVNGFNSTIYQHLQNIETTMRTTGSDTEPMWEQYDRRLIVYPAEMQGRAEIWYLSNQLDYDRLTTVQKWLMQKYCAAMAKLILGQIRSKFSEIPAAGGKISLNGSELISSAENELSELNEKIKELVPPAGFITG